MKKPLSPRMHGFLDYAFAVFLLLAPSIFGFSGLAATVLYVVAAGHTALSLMTAYPLGMFKKIPFTIHARIEITAAVFLIAAPWLLGFSELETVRNLYVITGVGLSLVWAVTNYRAAEHRASVYRFPESHKRMAA